MCVVVHQAATIEGGAVGISNQERHGRCLKRVSADCHVHLVASASVVHLLSPSQLSMARSLDSGKHALSIFPSVPLFFRPMVSLPLTENPFWRSVCPASVLGLVPVPFFLAFSSSFWNYVWSDYIGSKTLRVREINVQRRRNVVNEDDIGWYSTAVQITNCKLRCKAYHSTCANPGSC